MPAKNERRRPGSRVVHSMCWMLFLGIGTSRDAAAPAPRRVLHRATGRSQFSDSRPRKSLWHDAHNRRTQMSNLIASRPIGSVLMVATLVALGATANAATDGKEIFLGQKCNMCHAVSPAGITPTGKIKAPDLTGLAAKEDPAWVGKFLKKEAADK